jgi:hypothetical protein
MLRMWRACNLTSFSPCLTGQVDYLFASRHKGPRFKSPGGYLSETGILLLALSRSTYFVHLHVHIHVHLYVHVDVHVRVFVHEYEKCIFTYSTVYKFIFMFTFRYAKIIQICDVLGESFEIQ